MNKKECLFAVMSVAIFCANAQNVKEIDGEWSVVPKSFSFSGKPVLVTEDNQVVSVYDDDLNVVRTFDVQRDGFTTRFEVQERKKEVKAERTDVSEQPQVDCNTGQVLKLTWKEAKEWGVDESQSNRGFVTEAHDNYQLWPDDDYYYYQFEEYGRTYPTAYYQWNAEDGTINYVSVEYKERLTGDWETVEVNEGASDVIETLDFEDYDNNSHPDQGFFVSQTLFNSDEKFEYIIPIPKSCEYIQNEYDSDGDGISDHRTVVHSWEANGYKVLNEDGQTILELDMDFAGYPTVVKLNGKLYLEANGDFYKIDSQPTSVQKVSSVPASVKARYSVDGRRLSRPERGINILLKEDCTATKQLVK